jgi:hypothetical protein
MQGPHRQQAQLEEVQRPITVDWARAHSSHTGDAILATAVLLGQVVTEEGQQVRNQERPIASSPSEASEVGAEGLASIPRGEPELMSGGRLQPLALLFFEECHVEIAVVLLPALVRLDGEGPDEPQATRLIGKDPRHPCAAPDLLVEALEHVVRQHGYAVRTSCAPTCQRYAPPCYASRSANLASPNLHKHKIRGRYETARVRAPQTSLMSCDPVCADDSARLSTMSMVLPHWEHVGSHASPSLVGGGSKVAGEPRQQATSAPAPFGVSIPFNDCLGASWWPWRFRKPFLQAQH